MRKLMIAGLLTASLVLTACNTVRGLGRDMESVGSAVEQAAD